MKRIGLFAGVFDPIHIGHTKFIKKSVEDYSLDKVYILIEQEPKYKICLASYEHRRKMVELAIEDIPSAEIYSSPNKFFPISSSLPLLQKAEPSAKFFLLLGDDVAQHINSWPNAEQLLKSVELIVAKRGHDNPDSRVSSLKVRNELAENGVSQGLSQEVLAYCRDRRLYSLIGE